MGTFYDEDGLRSPKARILLRNTSISLRKDSRGTAFRAIVESAVEHEMLRRIEVDATHSSGFAAG